MHEDTQMKTIPIALDLTNCLLYFYFSAAPLAASTLCLLLITAERYVSVVHPYTAHRLTPFLRHCLLAGAWILSIIIMVVLPFGWPGDPNADLLQVN